MSKQQIPFSFILDYLMPLEPRIRPMFGSHAIYVGEKIVFIVRDRKTHTECNGIWMATSYEHHKSLKKEFPNMHSVYVLSDGKGETGWQMLHAETDDFESAAIRACEMVLRGDERIGKIPKPKKKKKKV